MCVCVINVSHTKRERQKCLFFLCFLSKVCVFFPLFDWLLVVLHFPPPFFFFVDNDTLNGTPHKTKKKRAKKKHKKRGKEKKINERAIFFDVQKDFDIKRWRRRRRRSCRRISTRAVHLPGCFHRPQRTSRFEARQNIIIQNIGFVVLATRTRRTRTQQKKLCDGKRSCPGRRP